MNLSRTLWERFKQIQFAEWLRSISAHLHSQSDYSVFRYVMGSWLSCLLTWWRARFQTTFFAFPPSVYTADHAIHNWEEQQRSWRPANQNINDCCSPANHSHEQTGRSSNGGLRSQGEMDYRPAVSKWTRDSVRSWIKKLMVALPLTIVWLAFKVPNVVYPTCTYVVMHKQGHCLRWCIC